MEKLIKILLSMICLTALTLYGEKQKVEQNQKIQYILEKYEDKSDEEKRKIRQAEKRLVNNVIKYYKLRNNEKIKKIKVVEYKKVLMTDSWRTDVWRGIIELNDKYRIVFKDEGIGEYIYKISYNQDEIKNYYVTYNEFNYIDIEYYKYDVYPKFWTHIYLV